MDKMDNKKTLWVVLGVVVLLCIIWVVVSNNSSTLAPVGNTSTTPTPAPAPTPTGTVPSASNLAYNAALLKYGTNRIQFQESCQALPNAMVLKTGTTIMLDNRASVAHTVKVDKTYTIAAHSFTTTTLSGGTLPRKILVDCGKSQNVATITLEK